MAMAGHKNSARTGSRPSAAAFERRAEGQLTGRLKWPVFWKVTGMKKTYSFSLLAIIYVIVGIIIAVSRHYITVGLLKVVGSALLCIFLWWLPLLGVNLHIS